MPQFRQTESLGDLGHHGNVLLVETTQHHYASIAEMRCIGRHVGSDYVAVDICDKNIGDRSIVKRRRIAVYQCDILAII